MALKQDLSALVQCRYGCVDPRYPDFCPHMTVAFRDLTQAAFHQAWPEFERKPLTLDFTAQTLTLLRHDGQRWQIHQDYSFGGD
ncbi:MAG: 2'-5' RNA ligase family protein [Cyanobacteria bacterium P01_H01_bin.26]